MRALLALLISLIAVTAGCIGSDEPVESASAPSDGGVQDVPMSATPAGATSTTSSDPPAPTAEAGASDAPTFVERTVPVEWNGKLAMAFCLPMGPNSCGGTTLEEGDSNFELKLVGEVKGDLELTWTSTHPMDEQLAFLVLDAEVSEDSWSGYVKAEVTGVSPLKLSFENVNLEPGHSVMVVVRTVQMTPDPVYGFVHTGTEFAVAGSVIERTAAS